jgi:hypothetical protein
MVVDQLRGKAGPANGPHKNRREERESWAAADLAQTTGEMFKSFEIWPKLQKKCLKVLKFYRFLVERNFDQIQMNSNQNRHTSIQNKMWVACKCNKKIYSLN